MPSPPCNACTRRADPTRVQRNHRPTEISQMHSRSDCAGDDVHATDALQCIESNQINSNQIKSNRIEWNRIKWNGMEWNGMEWNRMESNGMESNGMEAVHPVRFHPIPSPRPSPVARRPSVAVVIPSKRALSPASPYHSDGHLP